MNKCKDCICLECKFKPCEDCFTCDLEGYKPHNKCPEYENREEN